MGYQMEDKTTNDNKDKTTNDKTNQITNDKTNQITNDQTNQITNDQTNQSTECSYWTFGCKELFYEEAQIWKEGVRYMLDPKKVEESWQTKIWPYNPRNKKKETNKIPTYVTNTHVNQDM